ncbi:MAG: NAD(P)/FAD-dependent oxidoreductase, partial [Chitinophagaceae bacterium]
MSNTQAEYDAIVVGSGPNGLAAAIVLQQAGKKVLIVEAKETVGGGLRTAELTIPGFKHDICSAIHPMAANSPYFRTLPLEEHGLKFVYPEVAATHPLANGEAGVLYNSLDLTAQSLGEDADTYKKIVGSVVKDWPFLEDNLLDAFHFPKYPLKMAAFGLNALQ